ncbi:MAG: hypothetical protein RL557_389 [archaeon]|jgi:hypothetical protein
MKKSVIILCVVFCSVILVQWASASVGVSPGKYEIDFSPGYEGDFTFNFIFDTDVESEVYIDGDFKEYATLSTSKLVGGGPVVVHVTLPEKATKAGINNLLIGARQVSTSGGFSIAGNVIARIEIKVPYPGKYAEVFFDATNANAGGEVNFTVRVENLGSDSIVAKPLIKISDFSNNSVEDVMLDAREIASNDYYIYHVSHTTSEYSAGDYRASLIVEYGGGVIQKEKIFRLGTLYVGIVNYTREFTRDKINRFDVEVESFWNDPVSNLYAEISIPQSNITFITPSVNLRPWERTSLNGFFDTSSIKEDMFRGNITLFYYDEKTNAIADLHFKPEINYTTLIILGVIFLVILLIIIIFILARKLRTSYYSSRKKIKK